MQIKFFRPSEGVHLPVLPKKAKYLMKLYETAPLSIFEKALKNQLGFTNQVKLLPGFRCLSGNIICQGRAFLADTFFVDYADITIGNNVSFSFRNAIVTSSHLLEDFHTIIAKPVIIEDGVWITTGVTILGGVRIGMNSVIGAGSIVTNDIPPNFFAAGNPCIPIRKINRNS